MRDACFGNNFVSIQQRRYLGSKTKLLPFIDSILAKEKVQFDTFADIFAGTGVVANHFREKSNIFVNDILDSNFKSYLAFFGKQRLRQKSLDLKLNEYNDLKPNKLRSNYFSKNFANTYYDLANSKKIGYIRQDIEDLYIAGEINEREYAYLITSLLYAMDRIANTVGHYDAYRKIHIPDKSLILKPLLVAKSNFKTNVFKEDANELVKKIKSDVVYIDPPYNSRQYSDAYHLLENVACWKKEPVHGVAKKINRDNIKSRYSLKSAGNAFSDLINSIESKYILVSYNDMGTSGAERSQSRISDHEIISALERRGSVKIYETNFNQFTTGSSKKDDLKERVFFCRVKEMKSKKPAKVNSRKNTHMPDFVKSPLNYTGGKHKLLPQITNYFPDKIETFYDVFCGGANVGVNADADKIVCIDKNHHVVNLLNLISKSNFEDLNQNIIGVIEKFGLSQSYLHGYESYNAESSSGLGRYNKNAFLNLRDYFNSTGGSDSSLLLVLILYAFNNQIRFNSRGEFNLPVGKRDYNGSSRKNLANFNAITNEKNVHFKEGDFRDLKHMQFSKNDFIYLDPPYLLGLASYNESGGWSDSHEYELLNTLDTLNQRGVKFALSNVLEHKGKKHAELQNWANENRFKINHISHNYKNSNYQTTAKNGSTKEILVTNY